jgi:hypothetical protein
MWLFFLLGELRLLIAELTGAAARRAYLGQPSSELAALRDRLTIEHQRVGYTGVEAAALLGLSPSHTRHLLGSKTTENRTGRRLKVAPAVVYRQGVAALTMALSADDGVNVPDNCAARAVQVSGAELSLLAAEMRAAACRDKDNPLAVNLARFLAGLELAGDNKVPLGRVAATYGVMLSGAPWDLSSHSPFARLKLDALQVSKPDKQRIHLQKCAVQAGRVLALGRNTWAVQQDDPHALPPSLDTFLPGIEKRLG